VDSTALNFTVIGATLGCRIRKTELVMKHSEFVDSSMIGSCFKWIEFA